MSVGGQRHALAALPPGKQPRIAWYKRLGGPEPALNLLPPRRLESWTFQPVASRYIHYAIPAPQWRIIWGLLLQRRAVKMRNKLGWLRREPLWTLWCTMRSIKQGIPGLAEQGRVQHCLKYFSSLSLRGRAKWQAAKKAMYTGRTVPTTGVWIFSWQINNDYTCHQQLGDLLELRKRRERQRTQCVNISCIFLSIYLYSQLYNITCNKLTPKGRHIFDPPPPQTY